METLKRSDKNKVFAGVFGGIGEYLEIDPTLLRLVGLLLLFYSGIVPFLLVYFIAVFIVPKSEERIKADSQRPAYKKGWFWVILVLFIIFIIIPVLGLVVFRVNTDSFQEVNWEQTIMESVEEEIYDGDVEEGIDMGQ